MQIFIILVYGIIVLFQTSSATEITGEWQPLSENGQKIDTYPHIINFKGTNNKGKAQYYSQPIRGFRGNNLQKIQYRLPFEIQNSGNIINQYPHGYSNQQKPITREYHTTNINNVQNVNGQKLKFPTHKHDYYSPNFNFPTKKLNPAYHVYGNVHKSGFRMSNSGKTIASDTNHHRINYGNHFILRNTGYTPSSMNGKVGSKILTNLKHHGLITPTVQAIQYGNKIYHGFPGDAVSSFSYFGPAAHLIRGHPANLPIKAEKLQMSNNLYSQSIEDIRLKSTKNNNNNPFSSPSTTSPTFQQLPLPKINSKTPQKGNTDKFSNNLHILLDKENTNFGSTLNPFHSFEQQKSLEIPFIYEKPNINGNFEKNKLLQLENEKYTTTLVTQSSITDNIYHTFITTEKPNIFKNLNRPTENIYKEHKVMHPSYTGPKFNDFKGNSKLNNILTTASTKIRPIEHNIFTLDDAITAKPVINSLSQNLSNITKKPKIYAEEFTTGSIEKPKDIYNPSSVFNKNMRNRIKQNSLVTTTSKNLAKDYEKVIRKPLRGRIPAKPFNIIPLNTYKDINKISNENESVNKSKILHEQNSDTNYTTENSKSYLKRFRKRKRPIVINEENIDVTENYPYLSQLNIRTTITTTPSENLFDTEYPKTENIKEYIRKPTLESVFINTNSNISSYTINQNSLANNITSSKIEIENNLGNFVQEIENNEKDNTSFESNMVTITDNNIEGTKSPYQKWPNRNESKDRPRFSIKEYHQRTRVFSSTPASEQLITSTYPSIRNRSRFTSKKRLVYTSTTILPDSSINNSINSSEIFSRNNFNDFKRKNTTHQQNNKTIDNSKENVQSLLKSRLKNKIINPRKENSHLRSSILKTTTTTTTSTSSTNDVPTSNESISSILKSRRPPNSILRQKIQNFYRKKENDIKSSEDLVNITMEIRRTTESSSIENSNLETSVMKISKDNKFNYKNISNEYQMDLSESPSERIAQLTQSGSKNIFGIGKIKNISRKIPNYFTLATDDPILPIEAFFPNVKKENKNTIAR